MTKKLPFLWAVLLCLFGLSGVAQAQQNFYTAPRAIEAVLQEVNNSRQTWLHMFPDDELQEYGFESRKELNAAVPGAVMPVYYMALNLNNGLVEANASDEFLVPLMVNNQARAFLTVAFFEGRFQVVSVGEMNLAKDVSAFVSKKRSTTVVWLKNVNHVADFVAERGAALDGSALVFTPLFTAKRAGFDQPLAYRELVRRMQAMPVILD